MAKTNIEEIKSVPKYILKKIQSLDKKQYGNEKYLRFYAYLSKWKKHLIKITVAVKRHRNQWYYKQVAVHSVHGKECIVKDIEYAFMGGYRVGWFEQGLRKEPYWYESSMWYSADDKYYDPYAPIVNKDYIDKFPEYKYSAYKQYPYEDLLKYLRMYERFPQTEYLVKLGLYRLTPSVMILRQIGKDKRFRKWITAHRGELIGKNYYSSTILLSYKMNKPLDEIQKYEQRKKEFCREHNYKPIRELFRGKLEQFFSHIDEQKISYRLYLDYLNACNYLKLDMSENKNRIPHDFQRWHDTRIEQYCTLKFIAEEKERKERAAKYESEQAAKFKKFAAVAKKYLALQGCEEAGYEILIAKSPAELIEEGHALCHCVGGMGYDRKMIDERSLIFFVRKIDNLTVPFVTLEYSIERKAVLQCYAYKNQKPDSAVLDYVNNVWLPYANQQIVNIKKKKAKRIAA